MYLDEQTGEKKFNIMIINQMFYFDDVINTPYMGILLL